MGVIERHEKAKERLRNEILLALRLNDLRYGRHTIRDNNNWLIGEFWVEGVWLAYIEPSFDAYSALAIIHEKEKTTVAFVVDDGQPPVLAKFDSNWTDPVIQSLRHLDLFGIENENMLSLDGIGYDLEISSGMSRSTISFSNPTTKTLMELTSSLFGLATEIYNISQDSRIADYMNVWKKFLPANLV